MQEDNGRRNPRKHRLRVEAPNTGVYVTAPPDPYSGGSVM